MTTSTTAHLWLEVIGGTCAYEQYKDVTIQGSDARWSGIFKVAAFDSLELSNGTDASGLTFELRLCRSTDVPTLKSLKLENSFGELRYLDSAEPPLVGGVLVLHADTFSAVVDAIRTGRGVMQLLIELNGLSGSFSGDTEWNVKESPRLSVVNIETRIRYGASGVAQQAENDEYRHHYVP